MRLKDGVIATAISPQVWYAIGVAEAVYAALGFVMVVTSLRDGTHHDGSLHYSGNAVDIRIRDIALTTVTKILDTLICCLDSWGFDVVLEKDHIHIEYQPKGIEKWQIVVH